MWGLLSALLAAVVTVNSAAIGRPDMPCEPGELIFIECNLCTCNPQGYPNAVCARMWCQPPPSNKPLDHNEVATS